MATPEIPQELPRVQPVAGVFHTTAACIVAALIPGLGHAILQKWDRAIVFLASITSMFAIGLYLNGRLFNPDFGDLFSTLKFLAEAGNGLLYWVCWMRGMGVGEPNAYTYDFGNVFVYASGLLNMLIVVDTFDIAMGRKP